MYKDQIRVISITRAVWLGLYLMVQHSVEQIAEFAGVITNMNYILKVRS